MREKHTKIIELLNALKTDTQNGYELCQEWDNHAWMSMEEVVEKALNYLQSLDKTVAELRESGHAVAVFAPEEIQSLPHSRHQIENIMVEAVNNY